MEQVSTAQLVQDNITEREGQDEEKYMESDWDECSFGVGCSGYCLSEVLK